MAKKETRRDASLKLAIVLFLLAISQALAPSLVLGSRFVAHVHGSPSRIVLEADKHDWLGLAFRRPGSKPHDRTGRIDCLRAHKTLKAHCDAGGGVSVAGLHNAHGDNGGNQETGSVGGGPDGDGYFAIADLLGGGKGAGSAGGSDGSNPGGGFSGGPGGWGSGAGGSGGDSIGGGKGGTKGGSGGSGGNGAGDGTGSGGGGSGGNGSDGGKGSDGGAGGGDTGGGGEVGGKGGNDGSGNGAGGGNGATFAGEFFHSDPVPGCVTGATDCNGGDPPGSGCSLNNPDACTKGDGNKGGDPDCLEPALCGTPVINTAPVTSVPEPSTFWLMGAGIAALAARSRRRKPVAAARANL